MTPDKEQVVERLSASDASYPCIRCGTSLWHCGAPADPCCGDSDHPFATVEETIRALNDDLQAEHQSIADAARTASVAGLDRSESETHKHEFRCTSCDATHSLTCQEYVDNARLLSAPSIEQEPGETLRAADLRRALRANRHAPDIARDPMANQWNRGIDRALEIVDRAALEADRNPQETER